ERQAGNQAIEDRRPHSAECDGRLGASMLNARLAAVAVGVIVSIVSAPGPSAQTARAPRIVALGDSLTSGHGIGPAQAYPVFLQAQLAAAGYNYQVGNAGISGENSS